MTERFSQQTFARDRQHRKVSRAKEQTADTNHVDPVSTNNMNTSALMDLPNINTNLPPPLVPQQAVPMMSQSMQEQTETPVATNSVSVSSAEI